MICIIDFKNEDSVSWIPRHAPGIFEERSGVIVASFGSCQIQTSKQRQDLRSRGEEWSRSNLQDLDIKVVHITDGDSLHHAVPYQRVLY